MSKQHEIFNIIAKLVGQANVITIPVEFVRFTGDHSTAMVLSQLIYWSDKKKKDPDGWVYKSYAQWNEELALSEYQVRRAVNNLKGKVKGPLKGKPMLATKVKKAEGNPTMHYLIDIEAFIHHFTVFLGSSNSLKTLATEETQGTNLEKLKERTLRNSRNEPEESAGSNQYRDYNRNYNNDNPLRSPFGTEASADGKAVVVGRRFSPPPGDVFIHQKETSKGDSPSELSFDGNKQQSPNRPVPEERGSRKAIPGNGQDGQTETPPRNRSFGGKKPEAEERGSRAGEVVAGLVELMPIHCRTPSIVRLAEKGVKTHGPELVRDCILFINDKPPRNGVRRTWQEFRSYLGKCFEHPEWAEGYAEDKVHAQTQTVAGKPEPLTEPPRRVKSLIKPSKGKRR